MPISNSAPAIRPRRRERREPLGEQLRVDRAREQRTPVDEVAEQADEVGLLGLQRVRRPPDRVEPGVGHAGVQIGHHADPQPVQRRRPGRQHELLAPDDEPARLDPE